MDEDKPGIDETGRTESASLLASDSFYRALAERPRRRVLYYLLEQDTCTVDELADVLAGWETTTETIVSPEKRHRHKLMLLHSHLPHLADAGLVTYDRDIEAVSLMELPSPIESLLRRAIETESA